MKGHIRLLNYSWLGSSDSVMHARKLAFERSSLTRVVLSNVRIYKCDCQKSVPGFNNWNQSLILPLLSLLYISSPEALSKDSLPGLAQLVNKGCSMHNTEKIHYACCYTNITWSICSLICYVCTVCGICSVCSVCSVCCVEALSAGKF